MMSEATHLTIAQRQNAALRMRKNGLSYTDIAEQLGVSSSQVYHDVKAVLHDIEWTQNERAEEMRDIMIARIEGIIFTLSEEVETGNLYAIDRIVKLQDQLAGLMGLKIERRDITSGGERLGGLNSDDISRLIDRAKEELLVWKNSRAALPAGDE